MKKLLIVSAAALFIPAMAAYAGATEVAAFNQLDTDKNGMISQQEAKAFPDLATIFSDLDVDQDSELTLAEFEAFSEQ
ncbi:hypothetical protein WN093_06935 [Gammaproteobacteria bacterium AS21]|jgi:hypothetical protein